MSSVVDTKNRGIITRDPCGVAVWRGRHQETWPPSFVPFQPWWCSNPNKHMQMVRLHLLSHLHASLFQLTAHNDPPPSLTTTSIPLSAEDISIMRLCMLLWWMWSIWWCREEKVVMWVVSSFNDWQAEQCELLSNNQNIPLNYSIPFCCSSLC